MLLREPESSSESIESSELTSEKEEIAVVVVGVDHGDPDPSLGSFVLSSSPAAVVVETSLCARHGAETGTTLSLNLEDGSAGFGGGSRWEASSGEEEQEKTKSPFEDQEEPHVAQCLSLAERLSSLPQGSPEKTAFWNALSMHFAGEQLAYVAALSTGARLVFGDRPKRETVRRLLCDLTAADLDQAVAAQAASNTLESITHSVAPPPPLGGGGFGKAYDVLVRERDATICSVVAKEVDRERRRRAALRNAGSETDDDDGASSSSSTSTSFPASPSAPPSASPPRHIVVVVGKWHLEGVRSLWESGEWRGALEEEEAAAAGGDDPRPRSPPRHPSLSASEDLGLRRALVDELLRSTATAESAEEVDPAAFGGAFIKNGGGEGDDDHDDEAAARAAYNLTTELYGTARMQLALLDSRSQFDSVVSGWRCDFWEEMGAVRSVRAANGGKGFFDEEELVERLRALNFIFEAK